MASYRQRHYVKRSQGLHPRAVAPTVVDLVDKAGVRVGGAELAYADMGKLINADFDGNSCECGFMICGCDSRCAECGSLLHAEEACTAPYDCRFCDEEVEHDHNEELCRQAHASRYAFAPLTPPPMYPSPFSSYSRPLPLLYQEIVEAYLEDRQPPDDAEPLQVINALNAWASARAQTEFVGMDPRAKARCRSWLISMQQIAAPGDAVSMLQLLQSFNKQDASGAAYKFPVRQSIEHGQTALT
jgi:hypothetical protein